jgi:predicted XRE-type DNA-binding protein
VQHRVVGQRFDLRFAQGHDRERAFAGYKVRNFVVPVAASIIQTKMTRSSGNVFADLGLARPEERLAKAGLALEIERIIRKRGLTQAEAGKILGIDQPKVSALRRGRLGGFSVERLIRFLNCRLPLGAS